MSSPRFKIVVAEPFDRAAVAKLESIGQVIQLGAAHQDALAAAVEDCHALLVRSEARVTRAVFEHAPRLKVVGRGGVGLDNIDLEAARERGVTVVHTPAASTEAVADLTLGLIIATVRRITTADSMVRQGRFAEMRRRPVCAELADLTLGIIGLGRIGKAVARRCRNGLGMTVLYNDIVAPGVLDFVAQSVEKDRLYRESDVVSLHVPLTDVTRHLIRNETLSLFKAGAILINTARGAVVDGVAAARALRSGALGGAAFDVFDPEPMAADHPLMSAPNTVLTPHVAARTGPASSRMNAVVDDVIRVLGGEAPRHPA